jgi:hypothetical protein
MGFTAAAIGGWLASNAAAITAGTAAVSAAAGIGFDTYKTVDSKNTATQTKNEAAFEKSEQERLLKKQEQDRLALEKATMLRDQARQRQQAGAAGAAGRPNSLLTGTLGTGGGGGTTTSGKTLLGL